MSHPDAANSTRSRRVLLVEDDADTLLIMRRLLGRIAVDAVPASTCAAAQRASEELGGVDLLITDINLPDGTGLALASQMARQYGCETIIVSGLPRSAPLPEGVRFWLTKPIDFAHLQDAVAASVAQTSAPVLANQNGRGARPSPAGTLTGQTADRP
jgi:DNA-binding response OmpR family regulator